MFKMNITFLQQAPEMSERRKSHLPAEREQWRSPRVKEGDTWIIQTQLPAACNILLLNFAKKILNNWHELYFSIEQFKNPKTVYQNWNVSAAVLLKWGYTKEFFLNMQIPVHVNQFVWRKIHFGSEDLWISTAGYPPCPPII